LGVPTEGTTEHNVTQSVYFQDPDGNRVELDCDMVDNGFEAIQTIDPKAAPLDIAQTS
jgi:catechol-2,3-dioxygenase